MQSFLNLKGTLVREYARDLNIAFSYNIDGLRLLHLADNAHVLTEEQLAEMGKIDLLFISPPKVTGDNTFMQNIELLEPKTVILSHHIPLPEIGESSSGEGVENALRKIILHDGITNPHVNEKTVEAMTNIYMNGAELKNEFENFQLLNSNQIEITRDTNMGNPSIFHFQSVGNA